MTSQQIKARLERAVTIIAMCERVFEDPDRAHSADENRDAVREVRHFMDTHRQAQREGGQP